MNDKPLETCPKCRHPLFVGQVHIDDSFCPACGWALPTVWELFHLLREARNWVQDDTLRAVITTIAPPELRPLEPEATPVKSTELWDGASHSPEYYKNRGGKGL